MNTVNYESPEFSQLVIDEFKDIEEYVEAYKYGIFNYINEYSSESLKEREKIDINIGKIVDNKGNILKEGGLVEPGLGLDRDGRGLYVSDSIGGILKKLGLSKKASFEIGSAMKENIHKIFDEKYINVT